MSAMSEWQHRPRDEQCSRRPVRILLLLLYLFPANPRRYILIQFIFHRMISYCTVTIYTNFEVLRHHQESKDEIMSLENKYPIRMAFGRHITVPTRIKLCDP